MVQLDWDNALKVWFDKFVHQIVDMSRWPVKHNGGGNADVVDARFNVLIVCSASSEAPPN